MVTSSRWPYPALDAKPKIAESNPMSQPIRFRPHHFLCALGFQGKGYSDAFTANMSAIVHDRLRAENGGKTRIEVIGAADDICQPCPKRRGTLCTSQTKITRLDAA